MVKMTQEARREWRYGWPAVFAGTLGAAGSQIHFASLGVLIKPISEGTGWSTSTITFGLFICAVFSVPGGPLAGWLADRCGLNRVLLLGLPIFCAAFASLGLLSHSKTGWIVGWTLVAICGILVKANLWMYWIAQKFDVARGFAMSFISCGAGLVAISVPILTQLGIEAFGWRMAFPLLASTVLIITVPVCIWGFRTSPATSIRRKPAVDKPAANQPVLPQDGMTVRQAMGKRAFWQIAITAFLIGLGLVALQVHLIPMFQMKGMTARTAAISAGAFGGAALGGRFVGGLLLDHYSAKIIGMISLLLPAIACIMFLTLPLGPKMGLAIAALFGLGAGVEGDVIGYITSRFFGMRHFGTIFGFINSAFAFGGGLGPLAMALLLDHFGSYSFVVLLLFFALLLCALMFLTLGQYPSSFETDEVPGERTEALPAPD